MSPTELLVFYKKETGFFKEYDNSSRGASLLWWKLWHKFFPHEEYPLTVNYDDPQIMKLWRLDQDPRVSRELKILLISTFDHFLIRKENISNFINAIEISMKNNELDDYGHFKQYALDLRELINDKHKYKYNFIAIGWIHTTVIDDAWDVYYDKKCPFCGNIETLRRTYSISKDKEHTFVFDYLKEINEKEE